MTKIDIDDDNWDWKRTCQEEYCWKDCTHCDYLKINGITLVFTLCEKHAEIWNKKNVEADKKLGELCEKVMDLKMKSGELDE